MRVQWVCLNIALYKSSHHHHLAFSRQNCRTCFLVVVQRAELKNMFWSFAGLFHMDRWLCAVDQGNTRWLTVCTAVKLSKPWLDGTIPCPCCSPSTHIGSDSEAFFSYSHYGQSVARIGLDRTCQIRLPTSDSVLFFQGRSGSYCAKWTRIWSWWPDHFWPNHWPGSKAVSRIIRCGSGRT